MIALDIHFLDEVGLGGLSDEEKQSFLDYVREELELRTGLVLSEKLTEEELEEFEMFAEQNPDDQEKLQSWMDEHCPEYPKITEQVLGDLKKEILDSAGKLLAATPTAE